jgi:hypothetical protein
MASIKQNSQVSFSDDEKPERYLGKFRFTRKTVTFGQITLQLSNVSKIEVKSFKETIKPKFDMTDEHLKTAWKGVALGILVILIGGVVKSLVSVGFIILLAGGLGVWYYHNERNRKKEKIYNYHGLFFDCTSGKSEVLWSNDVKFTIELFNRISHSMNDDQFTSFVANFTENRFETIDAGTNNYYGNYIADNSGSNIVVDSQQVRLDYNHNSQQNQ